MVLMMMKGRLFGGRKRGERNREVLAAENRQDKTRDVVTGAKRRLPSPMHCAIALWLKIASDDELRTRGRKTPGEQTHAAKRGTFPGGSGGGGRQSFGYQHARGWALGSLRN